MLMLRTILKIIEFILGFFATRKVKKVEREAEKIIDTVDDGQPMSDTLNKLLGDE